MPRCHSVRRQENQITLTFDNHANMNSKTDVGGVNVSSDYNTTTLENNTMYHTVLHLQTGIMPVVYIIGFVGNIMAAGTFLSQNLRNTSCCLYLATKSVNDLLFLLFLFTVWLYRLDVPVFKANGVCQVTVFVTYTTGFLSVWFVVMITWENFIRVSLPNHVARLCNVTRAKYTIVILIIISVVIYSFSIFTTGLMSSSCLVFEKYEQLLVAMTCVDSILTLVIPLIVMVLLNIAISISAIQSHERRKRLFESFQMTPISRRNEASVLEMKVSRLLFAVSIIFLLLHTPSHVIRIKMMVDQNFYENKPSLNDSILHRIFELFYYMNFSIHCSVYLIFGDNFRLNFKRLYCSGCNERETVPTVNSSKRGSEEEAML